jgi:hypothetical protein
VLIFKIRLGKKDHRIEIVRGANFLREVDLDPGHGLINSMEKVFGCKV